MKRRIRLTESDLHRIVKESVKRILKEDEWDYDYYNEPPIAEPSVGSEEWFENEFDPKYSQVGNYENMSPEFVDWANMNDEKNDYDETKSWDNHFKELENDSSWREFDNDVKSRKRRQEMSKSPYFIDDYKPKKLPPRNYNVNNLNQYQRYIHP